MVDKETKNKGAPHGERRGRRWESDVTAVQLTDTHTMLHDTV